MKILAIETTTLKESVAIFDDYTSFEINHDVKTHSSHLLRTIDYVLKKTDTILDNLNYLACSIGPGSFTGIRIGLSTMQGLSLALKIPIIGISSLDTLAEGILDSGFIGKYGWICSLIIEREDKIYGAIFEIKGRGLKRIGGYQYCSITEFLENVKWNKKISSKIVFVGDVKHFVKDFRKILGKQAIIMPDNFSIPRASYVARLARRRIESKKKFSSFPEPLYVRPFWAKKQLTKKLTGIV